MKATSAKRGRYSKSSVDPPVPVTFDRPGTGLQLDDLPRHEQFLVDELLDEEERF